MTASPIAERLLGFLRDQALPLWASRGAYPNGCFVEHMDLDGRPVDPGFTRVRVQARQIYVYSHAERAGVWSDPSLGARAIDFFVRSAWLGPERGWAKLIRRDGALIDATPDLYDISFALFALAWRHRVAPDPTLLTIAHQTLDFLDTTMRAPHGGYKNDAAGGLPRQQNPHMHLTEAMNAWMETSGDDRFRHYAHEMVTLMENRFSDPRSGALGEFFEADWTPVAGPQGQIVEPGHQFEWAWIMAHYGRLTGQPKLALVERLINNGLKGFDAATGLTIDQTDRSSAALSRGHRLWPQTEALKALCAQTEFLARPDPARLEAVGDALFAKFLDPAPEPGLWLDHFDETGALRVDKIPATSLYHLTLAILEIARLNNAFAA